MTTRTTQSDTVEKLRELIDDIDIAMLTTSEDDGSLRSRPMYTQQAEFDGDLWFFTDKESAKVYEIAQDKRVNVAYAATDEHKYVSVSGTAQVTRDQQKINELWNPAAKAWFPDGKSDANLTLIKVTPTQAEYWDSPSSTLVQIAGFAKAIATGERLQDAGDNEQLNFSRGSAEGTSARDFAEANAPTPEDPPSMAELNTGASK